MVKIGKIIGFTLLTFGVILLLFSIYEMVNIYTGNASPPNLFNFSGVSLQTDQNGTNATVIQATQF